MKYVAPSVRETAFNCPHCGALTTQFWYTLRADKRENQNPLPVVITPDVADEYKYEHVEYEDMRKQLTAWAERLQTGVTFLEDGNDGNYAFQNVNNIHLSRCYNCDRIGIWVSDKLVHPVHNDDAPVPNVDLPDDIKRDFEEAASILSLSPRGAAALIRLAIQKLCKHLKQPGKNINDDIKALVAAGLSERVQKALDAVRVIGNNAVHPGHIDLTDDKATAETLFRLLNLIAEKMISEPKHVDEVYASLPESARKAIEARDKKTQ